MNVLNRRRRQTGDSCAWLRPLIRIWGITTAIVLIGVGVDITVHKYNAGIFILIGAVLTLFFEIKWVVSLFVQLLYASDQGSFCVKCWSKFQIFGGWRLAPFYMAFGIALIFWPFNLWLSYVVSIMLIMLALLRLCTIFRYNSGGTDEKLLNKQNECYEKNVFLGDPIDDAFPEVCLNLEDDEIVDEN